MREGMTVYIPPQATRARVRTKKLMYMAVFLIILSVLLWIGSFWALYGRQTIAPALSYVALLVLSFVTDRAGYSVLPINSTILTGWLCMTLVVMISSVLQPEPVRRQTRGMTYIIGGGITGLALGLLGFTFLTDLSALYACMILATVAGIFLGFLLYTNTPDGRPIRPGSGNFFRYLLAKGFPTAITLMQLGVALVLVIALYNINGI